MSSSSRGPRRVLVVDDSATMRALLGEYVEACAGFSVAGEAATGYQAIRLVHEIDPDIITLDLRMPDLGGVETLSYIMSEASRPVVIVSADTRAFAEPGVSAMLHGAVDYVAKPHDGSAEETATFRQRLRQALHAAAIARLSNPPALRAWRRAGGVAKGTRRARCLVGLAASTGGPRALAEIVPRLTGELPAAVLIVQHMPPLFTAALAKRLHERSELKVVEAKDGEPVHEGTVYLAPGGRHLELERTGASVVARLTDAAPVWGVRPAADVLFASIARTFGPSSVGVVLTGMGRDGADGMRALREVGAATLVQDEATALIGSMPRAAARYADAALPLDELAPAVSDRVAERIQRQA